ncbi:putative myosin light chain kinase 3 [Saguinus oedipus]|uniref:Myosin light chain kinase 3 n=1 Tax=Saguinus oedipus TaxID=9490 RepID=A0ABQ9TJR4_SAGOE|nr:putative myosin light chain kinase 3 [Saguinus oedipus]
MSGASKESLGPWRLPGLGKACLTTMDRKLNLLNEKVDQLLHFQEDITEKLRCMCRDMSRLERGLHRLEASQAPGLAGADGAPPANTQAGWPEVLELVRAMQQDAAQHGARLEALFRMVAAVDRAIAFVGATFQKSKVADFLMQGCVPWRSSPGDSPEKVGSCFPALAGREAPALVGDWPGSQCSESWRHGVPFPCDLLMGKKRARNLRVIGGFPGRILPAILSRGGKKQGPGQDCRALVAPGNPAMGDMLAVQKREPARFFIPL